MMSPDQTVGDYIRAFCRRHGFGNRFSTRIIQLLTILVIAFTAGILTALRLTNQNSSGLDRTDYLLGAGVILAIVGTITTGVVMSLRTSSRLRQLCSAVHEMAEGNLSPRAEIGGHDELSKLGENINRMAVSLSIRTEHSEREKNRMRSIHQGISDGIVVFDRFGRVTSMNPAAESALAVIESSVIGGSTVGVREIDQLNGAPDLVPDNMKANCWEIKNCTHPECPSYESADRRCWLQCGTCCHNEIQGTFSQKRYACERCDVYFHNGVRTLEIEKDGSTFSVCLSPILNMHGQEEGRIAVLHDITEIKAAENIILSHSRELGILNDVSHALTKSLVDLDSVLGETLKKVVAEFGIRTGVILTFNDDFQTMQLKAQTGISPQTEVFLQLLRIDREAMQLKVGKKGLPDMKQIMSMNKSLSQVLAAENLKEPLIVPLWAGGKVLGALAVADELKETYDRDEKRLLLTIAGQIGVAIQDAELFSDIARSKKEWETTFDAMTDGVSIHDEDFNIVRVNAAMAKMLGTTPEALVGRKCYEAVHGRTSPIPACPERQVMKTGKGVKLEIEEERLGKIINLHIDPVFSADGSVSGSLHVIRDVTEQKQLREQLLHSEKMAAVGQLVAGVAHELNNPLTGVMGYSQLLLRRLGKSDEAAAKDLNTILGEARRASRIVQNLLSFARKHESQMTMVDLNQVVQTVLDLRAYELNVSSIRVNAELEPDIPHVRADPHQMEQVLLNIMNNAEQAIRDTGRPGVIRIATKSAGGKIELSVSDNGTGIAAENLSRVFEPFFTTKEVGKGTGLGLSICYGIIEDHGGELKVESKPEEGTTISVLLPAGGKSTAAAPVQQHAKAVAEPRRVLVVDDEPTIVELLTDVLTMDGHGVEVASNGAAAMKKLNEKCSYDNVITDLNMPEMDGKELYRRIREIDPRLAANVIFITGDSVSADTKEYLDKSGNRFLMKPFDVPELRLKLQEMFGENDE